MWWEGFLGNLSRVWVLISIVFFIDLIDEVSFVGKGCCCIYNIVVVYVRLIELREENV